MKCGPRWLREARFGGDLLQAWLIALVLPLFLASDALSERSVWSPRDSLIASAFCIGAALTLTALAYWDWRLCRRATARPPPTTGQKLVAARTVGGFFAVLGIPLAIFAGDDLLEYTPIRLSWIGWAIVALGIAIIAFPHAGWVQRAVARIEGRPEVPRAPAKSKMAAHSRREHRESQSY